MLSNLRAVVGKSPFERTAHRLRDIVSHCVTTRPGYRLRHLVRLSTLGKISDTETLRPSDREGEIREMPGLKFLPCPGTIRQF